MSREIVVVGAGGFAKEMIFLLKNSCTEDGEAWIIKGLVDKEVGKKVWDYEIIGNDDWLLSYDKEINVVIGIGDAIVRQNVVMKLKQNKKIRFPNIISCTARMGEGVSLGEGCIVCDMNVLTVDVHVGDFVTLNLNNTIGHDTVIDSYTTVNPGCNISGNVNIGKGVMVGTGATIIQGIRIENNVTIGAGTVIIRDVEEKCTIVGNPGRIVRRC